MNSNHLCVDTVLFVSLWAFWFYEEPSEVQRMLKWVGKKEGSQKLHKIAINCNN